MRKYFANRIDRSGTKPNRQGSPESGLSALAASFASPSVRPSIALYVAGALVQISGLAAVSFQVGEWNFANFTIGCTLLGTITSYVLRRIGVQKGLLRWGAVALAAVFFSVLRRAEILDILIPAEGMLTQEVVLVCALALTATFGSFLLLSDDALIFTCVWSIAMIGLTGTVNVNRELPICFVTFLLSSSFLLVHQNAIRLRGAAQNDSTGNGTMPVNRSAVADRWRLLRAQLVTAFAAWGVALILGTAVSIPVQMVGRNMSLNLILQQIRAPIGAGSRGGPPQLSFNNRTDFTVGLGPVDDDPSVHLSVLSDKPHYWRGRTYDFYNGHGWKNSNELDRRPVDAASNRSDAAGFYTFVLPDLSPEPTALAKTKQIITDFRSVGMLSSPFYAAAEPTILRAPVQQIGINPDRTMGSRDMQGSEYQVVSEISTAHPSDLRQSGTHYPLTIRQKYLDPTQIDDSVQMMATAATEGAPINPYDRASAIKRFIANRCVYSQSARAVPHDRDAVDFFLNDSREGYCDLYASAMVALCRCAGLPARVATGYAPGIEVADGSDYGPPAAPGDSRRRYILRGNDLHAWAEVYFSHYGWIVFDATEDTAGVTPQTAMAKPAVKPEGVTPLRHVTALLFSGALLVALLAIGNEIRLRLGRGLRFGWRNVRNARSVNQTYRAALRFLARRGALRSETMTAGEYVRLIEGRYGQNAAIALRTLSEIEENILYSNPASRIELASDTAVAQSRDAYRDLRVAVKRRRKTEGAA